jgi:hypothetical protein
MKRRFGFENMPLGPDGHEARAAALRWEARYQEARIGAKPQIYTWGTTGWAFEQIRGLEGWKEKGGSTREEWERAWRVIEPIFGDLAPRKVTLQMVDAWYFAIKREHGIDLAWRAMKIWRALWGYMASMRLCRADEDPSSKIRRDSQTSRTEYWTDKEIDRLIEGAIKLNMRAVACIISIAWDTIFQPGDARTLLRKELFIVGDDWVIDRGRIKNGTKILGHLRARSRSLLEGYLRSLGFSLNPEAQIFRTRGYQATGKGGRPHEPAPYTKNTLAKDFRILRTTVFGPHEKRKLMDLRRSGTMEAVAGDATAEQIGQTLGNDFKNSKKLQTTYAPNHLASIKKVNAARERGRKALATTEHQFKPLKFDWETDLQQEGGSL